MNVTSEARTSEPRLHGRGRDVLGILAWLVLLAPTLFIWAFYGLGFAHTEGRFMGTGNGGPKTGVTFWSGWGPTEGTHIGNWRGAGYESFNAGAVIGALLWLGAGFAIRHARRRGPMMLALIVGFVLLYVLALAALWWAPLFWGPRHCVI